MCRHVSYDCPSHWLPPDALSSVCTGAREYAYRIHMHTYVHVCACVYVFKHMCTCEMPIILYRYVHVYLKGGPACFS